jgi:hypothetical protein
MMVVFSKINDMASAGWYGLIILSMRENGNSGKYTAKVS